MQPKEYKFVPEYISFRSIYDLIIPLGLVLDTELTEREKFLLAIIKHCGEGVIIDNYTISSLFGISIEETDNLIKSLLEKKAVKIHKTKYGDRYFSINNDFINSRSYLVSAAENKLRFELTKNNVKQYQYI
jgi:hypothetical protein